MSTVQTAGTAVTYVTRALQVVAGLVALWLILAPLLGDANFFEGLAWTLLGIGALVGVLVLEIVARGGRRLSGS